MLMPGVATTLEQVNGHFKIVKRFPGFVQHLGDELSIGLIAIGNLDFDVAEVALIAKLQQGQRVAVCSCLPTHAERFYL